MDNVVKAILIVLAVVLALGTVCLLSTTQIVVLPMYCRVCLTDPEGVPSGSWPARK